MVFNLDVSLLGKDTPMTFNDEQVREQELVRRCLAKDYKAWGELYEQFDGFIKQLIRRRLQPYQRDLVEDIAQEVWLNLWERDRLRLGYFDPERGKLKSFVASAACRVFYLLAREWKRRKNSEKSLESAGEGRFQVYDDLSPAVVHECIVRLSPRENQYLFNVALNPNGHELLNGISEVNRRQIASRLQRKFYRVSCQ